MGYAIFLSNIRLYEGNKRTQNQRDTPKYYTQTIEYSN